MSRLFVKILWSQTCFCAFWWFSKIRLPLQRISTAENFEGFYFAISWTGLTKVDKSGQLLTDEREGKEQGSTYWKQRASRPITAMWAG